MNDKQAAPTRIAFVADVHIGNHRKHGGNVVAGMNARCRGVIDALDRAVEWAKEQEVDAFVVCGDLFDTARPTPQMIAETQRVLAKVPSVVECGNHDKSSTEDGDHALGPLDPVATIVERPTIINVGYVDLICIPFLPGPASTWFEQTIADVIIKEETGAPTRLLAFHLGVEDAHTPSYLRGANDSIKLKVVQRVMEKHNIAYAFAGNWHEHHHWYVIDGTHGVLQCGTLAPTGFDNGGLEGFGYVALFDTSTKPHIHLERIPGPRFLTVRGPSAADTIIKSAKKEGNTVYVRWKTDINGERTAREEMTEWQDAGLIDGWEASVEDEEAEECARVAAKSARKAETMAEALAKFVADMPLEEGVDRNEVLARAQGYLGGA